LRPGDALAPAGANALLLIAMNVPPEQEGEFNEWYNTEHLPAARRGAGRPDGAALSRQRRDAALCGESSFRQCRRARTPRPGKAPPTPRGRAHAPHFRDLLRIDARRYTRK